MSINSFTYWHTYLTGIFKKFRAGYTVCRRRKSHLAKSQKRSWDRMRHSMLECVSSERPARAWWGQCVRVAHLGIQAASCANSHLQQHSWLERVCREHLINYLAEDVSSISSLLSFFKINYFLWVLLHKNSRICLPNLSYYRWQKEKKCEFSAV